MGRLSRLVWLLALPALVLATSGVDTLEPSAVTTPDDWVLYGGWPDKVTAVALPDDELTSMIRAYSGEIQQFGLPAVSVPGGSTIDSVTVRAEFGSYTASLGIRAGLSIKGDTAQSVEFITGPTTEVKWDTASVLVACPGGRSWTTARADSAEVFVRRSSETYMDAWISSLTVMVHYSDGGAVAKPKHHATMMGGN